MSLPASSPPSVSWAQTRSLVFVTFNVECEKPQINIDELNVSFTGVCAPDGKLHAVDIPLYANVDAEKSRHVNKGRVIELVLVKADEDAPYWEYLTRDKKKHHWLKVDFNRWHESDDSGNEMDYMNNMFANKMGFGDGEYGDDAIDDNDVDNDTENSSGVDEDEESAPEVEGDHVNEDEQQAQGGDIKEAVQVKEDCGDDK